MAEIIEVLEDGLDNVKDTAKKKPFLFAAVGVSAVALFVWWQKQNNSPDGSNYYEGSQAIGYAGYPEISSGGSSSTSEYDYYASEVERIQDEYLSEVDRMASEYDTSIADLEAQYNSTLTDMEKTYASSMEGMYSDVERLTSEVESIKATSEAQTLALTRSNDLAQMKANSELANALTGAEHKATRDALHAENLAIAEKYGWDFDERTGNYFNNGTVLYTTAKQNAQVITGKSNTPTQKVTFDSNVDYQAKINEAVKNGESSETIDYLKKQRQAKIDAVYGGVDPDTKSTTTSSGSSSAKSTTTSGSTASTKYTAPKRTVGDIVKQALRNSKSQKATK